VEVCPGGPLVLFSIRVFIVLVINDHNMTKLHTKEPVYVRGDVHHIPGTTSDGSGDWMETIRDSNGALVLRVHAASEQEAGEMAEFVALAINKFKKGL